MRTLKLSLVFLLSLAVGMFVYGKYTSSKNPTNSIEPIKFAVFELPSTLDTSDYEKHTQVLSKQKGVTAAVANPKSKLLVLTYQYNVVDSLTVVGYVENNNLVAKAHIFQTTSSSKGKCPFPHEALSNLNPMNWF